MLCGGCHNGFHHPTYDEWTSSPHSVVVESLAADFSSTNRATAISRMNSCGACHSGAVRLEMVDAYNKNTGNARTNVNWPSGYDATNTPIACVVCHDSHSKHVYNNPIDGTTYTNQLRYPLVSTNFFSYNTGTNFASQYNLNVNVCGQCHNARGASVSSSSRPPHHSPQYNIMLGNIGITAGFTPPQGAHRNNPRQCAGCHTHQHGEVNPTPDNPTYTGHAFRPHIEACAVCHTNPSGPLSATNLWLTVQAEISGRIANTKSLLDLWATTKNTNSWSANYEKLGWEYTTPGQLSNPSGSSSVRGPTAAEQAQIPQEIKDARFNLYLLEHDHSKGIHNPPYARFLLDVADQKVNTLLSAP
jgi:formate-dependent nitrite reductase cytochrome c552 subunit